MVYFHIDRVQRYLQQLGFMNAERAGQGQRRRPRRRQLRLQPGDKALRFGTGGVDDAEDAEIILHEYGHAIQDNQVPGFEPATNAAPWEGFGDYLAGSFFANVKRLDCSRASAPGTPAYSGDDPPSLRRLDSNKKYPRCAWRGP